MLRIAEWIDRVTQSPRDEAALARDRGRGEGRLREVPGAGHPRLVRIRQRSGHRAPPARATPASGRATLDRAPFFLRRRPAQKRRIVSLLMIRPVFTGWRRR